MKNGLSLLPPIRRHSGLGLRVTQRYGDKSNLAFYTLHGIGIPYHQGTDLTLGLDPKQAYGSELIAMTDGKVVKVQYDTPLSRKGNGITIQTPLRIYNGEEYQSYWLFWHCSKIVKAVGNEVKKGEIVAYLGNSGAVFPSPTPAEPYAGTHCHIQIWDYKKVGGVWLLLDGGNGVGGAVDPMQYMLDLYNDSLFGNPPSVDKKLLPFQELIDIIASKVAALISKIKK